jgi:hypothetical protein
MEVIILIVLGLLAWCISGSVRDILDRVDSIRDEINKER